MLKTSIDMMRLTSTRHKPARQILNGPTMGTRWSAVFHGGPATDTARIHAALERCVATVDAQMSTWRPDSDLMRINRGPLDRWLSVPEALMQVLSTGLEVGRLSGGAFDITLGDCVSAWGFGRAEPDALAIRTALTKPRTAAQDALELDAGAGRLCKRAPVALDLSGIAKGYAVDLMTEVLQGFGVQNALLGLDGDLRAYGLRPDGRPWAIAVERPDHDARAALSMIELADRAVATSGDYRHWVTVADHRVSHTMDPGRGAPLHHSPASVTVLARDGMAADAWATALMVVHAREGADKAATLARAQGLAAVFVNRVGATLTQTRIGL